MSGIDIASWLALALLLAGLHFWLPKERLAAPLRLLVSAAIAALIGGYIGGTVQLMVLGRSRFSILAFVTAALLAELAIVVVTRGGQRPR